MNPMDEIITVLEKEYAKIKYKEPWYQDAYNEIYRQLMIFGNVIDVDTVRDIINDKMLVRP